MCFHLCRFCCEWAEWEIEITFKDADVKVFIPVCKTHLDELDRKDKMEILNLIAPIKRKEVPCVGQEELAAVGT